MGKKSRGKQEKKTTWTGFVLANTFSSSEEAQNLSKLVNAEKRGKVFFNAIYQVEVNELNTIWGPCVQLSIKRRDREVIHDWRHIQRIKNEICGKDWEGVELYPAEERLVDTANQFYIHCFPPPFRFPFGFTHRLVVQNAIAGAKQRPFEDEEKPKDLIDKMTPEILKQLIDRDKK